MYVTMLGKLELWITHVLPRCHSLLFVLHLEYRSFDSLFTVSHPWVGLMFKGRVLIGGGGDQFRCKCGGEGDRQLDRIQHSNFKGRVLFCPRQLQKSE
jgi:hypothetical protein